MTRKDKAVKIAEEMNKVNNNVVVERMTKVLLKGMTGTEIDILYKRYYK